jgi:hypothetical protein
MGAEAMTALTLEEELEAMLERALPFMRPFYRANLKVQILAWARPHLTNTNGEKDGNSSLCSGRLDSDGSSPDALDVSGDRLLPRAVRGVHPVAAPAITEGEEDAAEFYERQREELLMDPPLPEPIAAGDGVHEISIKDHATPIAAGGECICPEDVVQHGFHQNCPIHGAEDDKRKKAVKHIITYDPALDNLGELQEYARAALAGKD